MTSSQARFEASILATPEAIADLTERIMTFLDARGVEDRPTHHTALILDEILTNLGTHGECLNHPAKIAVIVEPEKVTGEIVDIGPPFDPRLAPDPSFDLAPSDRPIGGLGLYLVRKLSCSLEYTRRNGENCMVFAVSRGDISDEGKPK
jgi:anti-sigma regulatory factor (Ser/Thr protein kinase)